MQSLKMLTASFGLLLLAGVVVGQQATTPARVEVGKAETVKKDKATKKSALEEALDLALKNNPDLAVATAKLAEAEAQLSRARIQTIYKVTTAYRSVESAQAEVEAGRRAFERLSQLRKNGAVAQEVVDTHETALAQAKAKLAAAQTEFEYVQGKGGKEMRKTSLNVGRARDWVADLELANAVVAGNVVRVWGREGQALPATEASDKMRAALGKKTSLSTNGVTLTEYLALVKKLDPGVNFNTTVTGKTRLDWEQKVECDFKDVTLLALLQFLEDNLSDHQIVVREYGLLIAPREKIPSGAMTLSAFMRGVRATQTRPAQNSKSEGAKP